MAAGGGQWVWPGNLGSGTSPAPAGSGRKELQAPLGAGGGGRGGGCAGAGHTPDLLNRRQGHITEILMGLNQCG